MMAKTSLLGYNTFGIDCQASAILELKSENEVEKILQEIQNKDFLILGGGSNILFTQDFNGTIILNRITGIELISENENEVLVEVGAGEVWHDFVLHSLSKNWFGVENLSLIPGCVGASPIQNIGAYGVEIIDVLDSVQFYHLDEQNFQTLGVSECKLGYRESIFKHDLKGKIIITKVRFRLSKMPNLKLEYGAIKDTLNEMDIENPTPQDVSKAVIHIRSSKLPNPKEIGNCGSFFKNPIIKTDKFLKIKSLHPTLPSYPADDNFTKIPAGWLIEQAGWKGQTFGNIGVHKNQALVLVNYGGGKGIEIKELAFKIIQSVKEKFDIELTPEVNII
jgi:UDP-N-acetylmuramate dehydrogenase